jgi:peroxiredoxin Q/BCP
LATGSRAGAGVRSPGQSAPDFELESHSGELVRLSSYRGRQAVALFFMRAYT